jgi:hypothetical protein
MTMSFDGARPILITSPIRSCVIISTPSQSSGRSSAQRDAIVIDRFFQTKQKAFAWATANQEFMTVRILMLELAR